MSRIVPIVKREFTQAVTSKAFIIGTVLGPLLLFAVFGLQFLIIAKSGGGAQRIAIIDASGRGLGQRVVTMVQERGASMPSFITRATYEFDVQETSDVAGTQAQVKQRVIGKELDGFLLLPPETVEGEGVRYEGTNATNSQVTGDLRQSVQRVVQSERLRAEGIDESRLGDALLPVPLEIVKTGEDGEDAGNVNAARILAMVMAFAIYIVVIMYGQSIMTSVQEEKRDRIVELIVSSVHAKDLLIGKVIGIGSAGVLQMLIWVAAAALLLTQGALIAGAIGASDQTVQSLSGGGLMPSIPASVGIAFVLYFTGGFLLFATLFAVIGAIVTNAQEAQQFVFPVLMPFVIGLFIAMPAADNPNGSVAVIGSLVPFTSAMVMPVRMSVGSVDLLQVALSIALLFGTAAAIVWLAAKIYRVAIFATGQKPTAAEIYRWMRAA
ncbi:MAG TPA: ABC transporter permease [Longimicrobiales bacterium]|nr:ABC transporter permease [Longimicrobiales bacterium]